jgi:hypothetical protein
MFKDVLSNKELKMSSLGEAPIQTQATARKYRKMPMGRTGIAGLRLFLRWLRGKPFTLYSAKTGLGGAGFFVMTLCPLGPTQGAFHIYMLRGETGNGQ